MISCYIITKEIKMKKLKSLSIVPIILLSSVNAETFKINLDKKHQEAITVEVFVDKNKPLVCDSPLILNETKDACVSLTCEAPLVLNDAEDSCINPIAAVGWIDMRDSCGGLAPTTFNSRIFYARAKSITYSMGLEIPKGYRWLTSSEWKTLYENSNNKNNVTTTYGYHGRCGHASYPLSLNEGTAQYWNHFNDGRSIHSGHTELTSSINYTYTGKTNNFSGYVLYKED
jgi:hypothetical protein